MHLDILGSRQKKIFPQIKIFKDYYLAGGTGLALQIGHRKSIDFDLFTNNDIQVRSLLKELKSIGTVERTLVSSIDELTVVIDGVKISFIKFPFDVKTQNIDNSSIYMPSLISIASMKAYAIGRRSKWKDYVDMYFILQENSFSQVVEEASSIFGTLFSEKNFREQLCYFDDIDYAEAVEYMIDNPPTEGMVREFLCKEIT